MINKISPLAPKIIKSMKLIQGINIYTYCAGLYNLNRNDLALFLFDSELNIAEVFTKSRTRSVTLDWNEKLLKKGKIKALLINSGNANAYTGKAGLIALKEVIKNISNKFTINMNQIFIASTGVIGEPYPYKKIINALAVNNENKKSNWLAAAKAIMTTDTYPKMKMTTALIGNRKVQINGVAKGSGMIAPNMATLLGFIFTDANISRAALQSLLKEINEETFNSITVDGDESTNDTVMLISTNKAKHKFVSSRNDKLLRDFKLKLKSVMMDLAEQIVKDGEGATKLIQINVNGAKTNKAAKKVARSIAESPLVKTAIYGEDPNWGRIVMAIGKSKQIIDPNKFSISLGDNLVASNGSKNLNYKESVLKKYMKKNRINILVDLKIGLGNAQIMTCDYSNEYININASYKS